MAIDNILLDVGAMSSAVILNNGKRIFKKTISTPGYSILKTVENKLFYGIQKKLPYNYHLITPEKQYDLLEREALTSHCWKSEGIPTLNFEEINDDSISWEYLVNSETVRQKLNKKNSMPTFNKFVETYDKIRGIAKKKKNPMYFHSDPHLANFMIDSDRNIIPIDSGCMLDRSLTMEELDFHLLKRTLMSISGLKTSNEMKIQYIDAFSNIMSDKKKEMFLNWDYSVSPLVKGYSLFREFVISATKGKSVKYLDEYNSFVSFFNSDIRSVLEK